MMISAYSNHHLLYPIIFFLFLLCSQIYSFLQIKLINDVNYKYRIAIRMIVNLMY